MVIINKDLFCFCFTDFIENAVIPYVQTLNFKIIISTLKNYQTSVLYFCKTVFIRIISSLVHIF